MIKIVYIDEEPGWQSTAHAALSDKYDIHIPEVLPKNVSDLWDEVRDCQVAVIDYRLNESGQVAYTGDDVVREIHKHNKYFPAIIITSYEDNAIQECDEVQIIRGKNVLNTSENLSKFKHLIKAAVERYQSKKAESEAVVQELSRKIDKGEPLTETEYATKFDAELYLSELDLDSRVRANIINQQTSQQMAEMLTLAQSIVERLDKKS